MRNALMPLVASASEFIGWAMGGLVAIEVVFSWPGLGREIVTAVSRRDYPVLQGSFIVIAAVVMVLYLFADMVATRLDPRAGGS
jgi:peptide/nickel transport system permease protein